MAEDREYAHVTFRVPKEVYVKYKMILLQEQRPGRKTPTSDLNAYILSVLKEGRLKEL